MHDMIAGHARGLLADLYATAVSAVDPARLTARAVDELVIPTGRRLHLVAAGKGSAAMASGALGALGRRGHEVHGGVVVAPGPAQSVAPPLLLGIGDHPLPGSRSFAAARRIGEAAAHVGAGDQVLVLISGGASSLVAAPLPGIGEDDIRQLFALLLRSGLDIAQVNTVRKRFTRWGAGRLALALAPARVDALLISDVPGDHPAHIASGPCSGDPGTVAEVVGILRSAGLLGRLPVGLRSHLHGVASGALAETPKPEHPAFARVEVRVVGTNRLAVDAAIGRGRALGMPARRALVPLAGDAAAMGATIADELLARAGAEAPGVVVWGGETTVALPHAAPPGGRCQELALAAARRLATGRSAGHRITLLAAGTDGRDGPTDAAGAFADDRLWDDLAARGLDPARALARHDAHRALDAAGALHRCGLTGTNVMDLVIGVVERAPATR